MRRRQINALRAAGVLPPVAAHLRELWEADRAADRRPRQITDDAPAAVVAPGVVAAATSRGDCPHCGRHFAKGLHFHMRTHKA